MNNQLYWMVIQRNHGIPTTVRRERILIASDRRLTRLPAATHHGLNLGLLHHDDGNLKGAEACYRRALHYGPALALAHFHLAVVLEDQHDKNGAVAAYEEALRSEPTFREAHWNLAQLYEQLGRRRDAVRHYATAKRLTD